MPVEVHNTVSSPSHVVVQAHTINGDVVFGIRSTEPEVAVAPVSLPDAIPHFVGRRAELTKLTASLDRNGPNVVLLDGMAGAGKTTLAAQWMHGVRDHFPDGVLKLDLRGFASDAEPLPPLSALRMLCRALGIADGSDDHNVRDDQVLEARYRTALHKRRCLLVLDNARSSEQVLPLLPGSPHSTVVVTSRHRLDNLIIRTGATRISVGIFDQGDANELLVRYLGRAKVDTDPKAIRTIVNACSRLPLALSIIAARARAESSLPLAVLAEELRDEYDRLDALDTGDPEASLRAVFALSLRALDNEAAHLFRTLGRHPGPDCELDAAAAMTGLPVRKTRAALKRLVQVNLLNQSTSGRYTCHNLLKAYAAELADAEEPVARCLRYYLDTAMSAQAAMAPRRPPLTVAEAPCTKPRVEKAEEAAHWFRSNHANLIAAYAVARIRNDYEYMWRLLWALMVPFDRELGWDDWSSAHYEN
jgi:hypothetical protein